MAQTPRQVAEGIRRKFKDGDFNTDGKLTAAVGQLDKLMARPLNNADATYMETLKVDLLNARK